jgi:hypothetical protein
MSSRPNAAAGGASRTASIPSALAGMFTYAVMRLPSLLVVAAMTP